MKEIILNTVICMCAAVNLFCLLYWFSYWFTELAFVPFVNFIGG